MTILIVVISYYQFKEVFIAQYSKAILNNANIALGIIKNDKLQGYLNGEPIDRDYEIVYNRLKRLLTELRLDYIYVCNVLAPDYREITYIFDPCNSNSQFTPRPFRAVDIYDDAQFKHETKKVFENSKSVVRYVLYNKDPHITANVPIIKDNKVIAMLGLRYSIAEFSAASKRYFITINIVVFCVAAIFVAVLIKLFELFLITPMARHNVLLRIATDEAQNATRAKSLFLATMSHEIRTPMNAIIGFSKLATDNAISPVAKEYLQKITRASHTLLNIINDILDFTKIESEKMSLVCTPYNLDVMISDVADVTGVRIREKPVTLKIERDSNIPNTLIGDEVRLKQILLNLASNSAKFTDKGEIVISVRVAQAGDNCGKKELDSDNKQSNCANKKALDIPSKVTKTNEDLNKVAPNEEPLDDIIDIINVNKTNNTVLNAVDNIMLTFSVRDTGIGIKSEDVDKVFNSFQQVNMARNRKIEGTGLGLSISKQLVSLMGGVLELKSEYGKGCEFFFTITQGVGSDFAMQNDDSNYKGMFICPDAKILVVDDNEVNLEVARGYLTPYKCKVITAKSGGEALDILKHETFDIIFMDFMMPEMDGVTATKKIREQDEFYKRRSIIILLTAASDNNEHDTSLFDGILGKPLDEMALKDIMARFIVVKSPIQQDPNVTQSPRDNNQVDNSVLRVFLRQIDKKVTLIDDLVKKIKSGNEDALNLYKIEVHALKSSAKSCGFDKLSGMALRAEQAAGNKNTTYIMEETDFLLDAYKATKEVLHCALGVDKDLNKDKKSTNSNFESPYADSEGGIDTKSDKNDDVDNVGNIDKIDSTLCQKMNDAAKLGDIVTLEENAQKIENATLRNKLLDAIDDIDFDEVKKLLKEFIK